MKFGLCNPLNHYMVRFRFSVGEGASGEGVAA